MEVLHAIEDELCASIGYTDHQRVSAVHTDTDHLHVHVAINKVHPTGLQNIEPYYDKKRLMEACERLEIKYDLQRTNHGLEGNDHDRPNPKRREELPEEMSAELIAQQSELPSTTNPEREQQHSGAIFVSPTISRLPDHQRPKRYTVCETCPAGMWHVLPTDLRCYCRATHALVYITTGEEPLTDPMMMRDGREMAIEEMLAAQTE